MPNRPLHRPAHVGRTVVGGLVLVVVGLLVAGMLAACDPGGGHHTAASAGVVTTPSPAITVVTPTPPAGVSATPPAPATPSSPTATTAPKPAPASPTSGSLRVARCTADQLTGTLTEGDGAGAGSTFPYLVLENTGTHACQLQGWPGVSFVGGGNGTQLGAAATFDRSSPHAAVTLLPNGHAHAPLKIAQAANYPKSTCKPAQADGLRVYVPGETHSIFVKASGLTACTSSKVQLLQTQAIQPGAD